jgi:O-antigen/teichoic acid export membrane protein
MTRSPGAAPEQLADRTGEAAEDAGSAQQGQPPTLIVPEGRLGVDSILLSASLLVSSLSGAGVALALTLAQGSKQSTDAIFAAYSLYGIAVLLVITGRSVLIPLFGPAVEDATFRARARDAGSRTALASLLAGIAVAVTAPLAGPLITGALRPDAQHKATLALLLFAPSVYLQGRGAVAAAVLTAASRVRATAVAYALAAVVSIGAAAPLVLAIGPLGAPVAILIGSFILSATQEAYLRRFHFALRLHPSQLRQRRQWRLTWSLVSISMIGLATQAQLALSVRSLPGDSGSITSYVYAYFFVMMLLGVTSASAAMVSLPGLVRELETGGDREAAEYVTRVSIFSLAIVFPLLAGAAAFGRPLLRWVFSGSLAHDRIDQLYHLILVFAPMALLFVTTAIATPIVLARKRERALLIGAAVVVPLQLVADLIVHGHALAVGAAQSVGGILLAVIVLAAATGRHEAFRTIGRIAVGALPALALALPFAIGALTGGDASPALAIGLSVVCLALYLVAGSLLWPSVLGRFPVLSSLASRVR